MTNKILTRIQRFNQERIGASDRSFGKLHRLHLKYQRMRVNQFAFFRGTCHLFYEDWPTDTSLNQAPATWICGDLHLENFGSFKGTDRQIYFDINDFDEAAFAPCTWDLTRFLTSVLVAAHTLDLKIKDAEKLCILYLDIYRQALTNKKPKSVRADNTSNDDNGMIHDLFQQLQDRKRQDFLDERTEVKGKRRQIRIDPEKAMPLSERERSHLQSFLHTWAETQENPAFFDCLDVVERIAGLGSVGLKRYLLLIEGKGSPDRNYLLDLKQATPSSLQPYLTLPQPQWSDEATRIMSLQTQSQAVSPALLHDVTIGGESFVLKELQPTQDRVNLSQWNGKLSRLEKVITTMAQLTAWAHLRGYRRSADLIETSPDTQEDALIAFAQTSDWYTSLLQYAKNYADQVEVDYQEFCDAFAAE
jgi:uncharacterized protein (DUF2252 family)